MRLAQIHTVGKWQCQDVSWAASRVLALHKPVLCYPGHHSRYRDIAGTKAGLLLSSSSLHSSRGEREKTMNLTQLLIEQQW